VPTQGDPLARATIDRIIAGVTQWSGVEVLVQEDNGDSGHNDQSAPRKTGAPRTNSKLVCGLQRLPRVASDRDDFGMRDRRAVVAGEQASMLRQRVAIEHGLHPLLPLATLVNERVTRPHPRAQTERCSGAIQHSGNLPAINSSRRCLASARSFFACCLFPRNALV
jgi:hypothetical protein